MTDTPYIEDPIDPNANQTVAALVAGMMIGSPDEINGVPVSLRPGNWTLELYPELAEQPQRISTAVGVQTLQSFLDYWNRFAEPESMVFVDILVGAIHGIIDYHGINDPRFCEHEVRYLLPKTPDWEAWREASGKPKNQEAFARWLEDHIDNVAEPAGAELLEVARTLEAKRQLHFRSGVRLDNGAVQLSYVEDIEGQAGVKGQLQIPTEIKLGLRLIRGGDAYEVQARFRYRIKDGGCVMWFELIRPDRVWDHAVDDVIEQLRDGMAHGTLIEGRP